MSRLRRRGKSAGVTRSGSVDCSARRLSCAGRGEAVPDWHGSKTACIHKSSETLRAHVCLARGAKADIRNCRSGPELEILACPVRVRSPRADIRTVGGCSSPISDSRGLFEPSSDLLAPQSKIDGLARKTAAPSPPPHCTSVCRALTAAFRLSTGTNRLTECGDKT